MTVRLIHVHLLLAGTLLCGSRVSADAAAAGHTWFTQQVQDLARWRQALPVDEVARRLVDETVDMDAFAQRVLGNYVDDALSEFEEHLGRDEHAYYVDFERQRIVAALRQYLIRDLQQRLLDAPVDWSLSGADFDHKSGKVTLGTENLPDVTVHLERGQSTQWRIVDAEVDKKRLSRTIRDEHRRTIDREYSPAALTAQLLGRDYIVLEDFAATSDGELPLGWRWRDRDEDRRKPYTVRTSAGRTWLAAQDSGGSVLLLRFAHWNPRQYPIMTWCWRADEIPPGGDERFGHTNDSVAGIYVFFSQTWIGMPRHIKYVWSSTLPEGTIGRRDRIARPYFVVVDSGEQQLGEWVFARVDLEQNYDDTWGGRPKSRTQGLGLLTDANSTDSRAEAYYADLRVWTREADEAGRVHDHCGTYRELGPTMRASSAPLRIGAPRSGATP